MIPSLLAREIRRGVDDYLRTAFPVTSPYFGGVVEEFLAREAALARGPYVSVGLPFSPGKKEGEFFPGVPLGYRPYLHQERAFARLAHPAGLSTVIATGTGSGKTECFLWPVLDYCLQHRGERGVKALFIYPMNALASDQAQRAARAIHNNPELRGRVTAGLYVGSDPEDTLDQPVKAMTPDRAITCRYALRENPPDILLTNYKMLDFLLLRPADRDLWRHNVPDTLRYLVVDELHTFDGAQGTDLSCLLRRLKARLDIPRGRLCCVGTSATLGEKEDGRAVLDYAAAVFGEEFGDDALITEERLTAGEFLERDMAVRFDLPPLSAAAVLDPENYPSPRDYLEAQAELWFGREGRQGEDEAEDDWRARLGGLLRGHVFFQNFLKALGGRPAEFKPLIRTLARVAPALGEEDDSFAGLVIYSLLALASHARRREGERLLPLATVQIQAWFREMNRMVVSVPGEGEAPRLLFSGDLKAEALRRSLPAVHCRDCGAMGWSSEDREGSVEIGELTAFYHAFFSGGRKVRFLFPSEAGAEQKGMDGVTMALCPSCMGLGPASGGGKCSRCGAGGVIPVFVPNSLKVKTSGGQERVYSRNDCPFCGAANGLSIVGARSATLSSVMISQAMTSRGNDDKKMLAFSDSVQDAAHHAGFFGARTYRFTIRSAMARFLDDGGDGAELDRFARELPSYWEGKLSPGELTALFIAPNQAWRRDFIRLKETGAEPGPDFMEGLKKRLEWEAYTEFGLNSHIGRTMEKSGVAVAAPDPAVFAHAAALLGEALRNALPGGEFPPARIEQFLMGLVLRMKGNGAVCHPALDEYVRRGGESYMISTRIIGWMPPYGKRARRPVFLTLDAGGDFDRIIPGDSRNWFDQWMLKCFGQENPFLPSRAGEFWREVTDMLSSAPSGLLRRMTAGLGPKAAPAWGLEPSALRIFGSVQGYRCGECGAALYGGELGLGGLPCLRRGCGGVMEEAAGGRNFYGRLYSGGDLCRLYPEEHTGLLPKGERTLLEDAFRRREGRKPWDPNLLSCTPTLEMGIDIGDLSTLMLCSVPPDASSFRQRTGRAGRRDGNSLALTVARGRPHDLYFFADPMNMIAGDVSPPGVFLGASAVLERQFAAFCLDCWVRAGAGPRDLPERASAVLNRLGGRNRDGFPYSFLKFVDQSRTELLERFFALFGDEISPEVRGHIERFASSGEEGLPFRLVDGLVRLQKQRDSLQRRAKAVKKALEKMKEDPAADEKEMDSLALEKRALERLFREQGERSLLNMLTDEGLIPNYAFPESGVTLRSVIYRRTADGKPESDVYKFERAAASALKELAPESVFYAGGRKARISQVDMSMSEVEEWRFCDNCSYMAPAGAGEGAGKCPRCGSSGFGDTGQKRKLLRMRQVFAYGGDRETMITDDSDDRETVFYTDQTLVDFEPSEIKSAWRSEGTEKPFGFEFISRAVLREVNFGRRDDYGEQVRVDGQLLPRKGFLICRRCGMVQEEGKEQKHTSICPAKNRDAQDNILDCVYLYRELHSEALRILLPLSSSAATEEDVRSFTAALQLGFRRYFRGDTGHLRCTRYEEPEGPSGTRRAFLLVYDSIPGGTGYLKQLALTGGELAEVMQRALDTLTSCPCGGDPERDGCYRCIYAYGSSFHMQHVSRKRAAEMLTAALEHRDSMLPSDTISGMEVNASFDSELEALFTEGLRRRVKALPGGEMAKHVINGKSGYYLRLGEGAWYLEPQVHFGKQDGVEVPSVADFVLWPARTREGVKPSVVFTDGYAYHRDRPGRDSAQRTALLRTGRFRVWSITWKDVEEFTSPGGAPFADPLYPDPEAGGRMAPYVASLGDGFFAGAAERGEMDLLVRSLLHPHEGKEWRLYARYRAVMLFSGEAMANAAKSEGLREALARSLGPWLPGWAREALLEEGRIPVLADRGAVRVSCSIHRAGMGTNEPGSLQVYASLDDGDGLAEGDWRAFLRAMNLFQFVEGAAFFTVSGVAAGEYDVLQPPEAAALPALDPSPGADDRPWREALELMLDPDGMEPVFDELKREGWPAPLAGHDVTDGGGAVVAQAELAWPDRKVALLAAEDGGEADALSAAGWRAFPLEDVRRDGPSVLTA